MLQPILKINLTTREISHFEVAREWLYAYLGAASLAARLLYDHLTPALDPLSPSAPLLFLNGPLTGTAGPAVGRFVICAKSPATHLWGESNCGGFWGPELRKAGFDGLWVEGRAETPVYLWIHNTEVEIRDASHLWGLETYATQTAIQTELDAKNVRIATIGPAGERQIPFALVLTDHGRVGGRTGMGAVMGSKNLKAIAVKGTGEVPLITWANYKTPRANANRALKEHNATHQFREVGSAGAADYFAYLGEQPKKYYQSGTFEGGYKITGTSLTDQFLTGISACHACVIACGRVVDLGDGVQRKGPEYETMAGFGPNLLIDDLAGVIRLGELCELYGLDTISMSNIIGLAFSLYERGRLTLAETGGLALEWGSVEAAAQLIHLTARRKGIGRLLSEGSRALEARFGDEGDAVQVNGLEVAYHDPRGASGHALGYATSPRGACHNQSDYFMVDIFGQTDEGLDITFHPRQAGAEKARDVARHQDWRTVNNALVLCMFASVPPLTVLELINTGLGLHWTMADLLQCGERAWNLKRAINHRLGLTRAHDKLPKALLKPYEDGGSAGYVPPIEEMLTAYYAARGWDAKTGRPTPVKLRELGLDWVVDDLWMKA
ncbi:MAG: aldehyde ferredoxin oxidoreductase family protein [Anaerolineales bacterium]